MGSSHTDFAALDAAVERALSEGDYGLILGLIALAQIEIPGAGRSGSHWEVPPTYYDPIRQQAVLLNDTPATRAFASFLREDDTLAIIQSYGFDLP